MQLIQRLTIKVISASLLVNSLTIVFTETASARPCKKDWFHRAGCAIDPTNPDRNGGRTQRLDPTNPNSPGGKVVRKTVPVACGVAGAVYSAPGVVSTVEGTVTAHKTCYKVIKYIQNR
jgi:hypothetical protein